MKITYKNQPFELDPEAAIKAGAMKGPPTYKVGQHFLLHPRSMLEEEFVLVAIQCGKNFYGGMISLESGIAHFPSDPFTEISNLNSVTEKEFKRICGTEKYEKLD